MANCVTITVVGTPPSTTTCIDPVAKVTRSEGETYCMSSTNTQYVCRSGLWKEDGECDETSGDFSLIDWIQENSMLVIGGCTVAAAFLLLSTRRGGDD